jgi:hypothetical protein
VVVTTRRRSRSSATSQQRHCTSRKSSISEGIQKGKREKGGAPRVLRTQTHRKSQKDASEDTE